MSVTQRIISAVACCGVLLIAQWPTPAEARVSVEDRELVSKSRVGRTQYLFTYRLVLDNPGTTLDGVKVWVACDAPGTTIVDDVVEFGDIPERSLITSTDTFSLRQDRRVPFDPACLRYEVGFNTKLVISGQARDEPLANAEVTATVIRPSSGRPILDSGRPIIEEYSTVADADGNYTLEVDAVTEDDYVTLQADGVGEQDEALLTSTLGSVGSLQEQGSSGSIVIVPDNNPQADITHITTAQDELIRRANGGVLPTTDAEYAALQSQISGQELLEMAAVIKTIIDNPNIVLPPGINNTLELIQNPVVFEQTLNDLRTNFPNEFNQAIQETAEQLNIGFAPNEIPGRLYAAVRDVLPFSLGAYVFDFGVNGNGRVIFRQGDADTIWLLNSAGEIEVTPADPFLLFENFPFNPQCTSPSGQCRAEVFLETIRLVRITNGPVYDQVFVLTTTRTTYPDDPLPDEVVEDAPGPNNVLLAFGDDGILPVEPVDVAGDEIATYYFHQDNDSVGLNAPRFGADFLSFNADGTGSTARRGFGFNWSSEDNGALNVNFDNGDSNQYIVFSEDGDVAQVIVIGTLAATGQSLASGGKAISYDGVSDFSEPNLANRRYRNIEAAVRPGGFFAIFDYLFLPDGTGCRLTGEDEDNVFAQRLTWESTPLNRMDSIRFVDIPQPTPLDRRGWQAIDEEPGRLGPRFWVIENADFASLFDPNFMFSDPTVTPGRINSYEFVEDLTGQFDPCGFASSTSLTTLFDSNNGAVGNMFDLETNDVNVAVTGLDLNVDFAAGTQFDIEVYTVSGSFEDTITAPPTCTFNCAFDASQWTLTAAGTGTAQGRDQPSFVDIDDFSVPPNTALGVWITLARDGSVVDEMRYTNIGGTAISSDANLQLTLGVGVTGQAGAEGVVRNRAWNGTIYYDFR